MAFGDFFIPAKRNLIKAKKAGKKPALLFYTGGRWDLNPRPLEPQSSALTN